MRNLILILLLLIPLVAAETLDKSTLGDFITITSSSSSSLDNLELYFKEGKLYYSFNQIDKAYSKETRCGICSFNFNPATGEFDSPYDIYQNLMGDITTEFTSKQFCLFAAQSDFEYGITIGGRSIYFNKDILSDENFARTYFNDEGSFQASFICEKIFEQELPHFVEKKELEDPPENPAPSTFVQVHYPRTGGYTRPTTATTKSIRKEVPGCNDPDRCFEIDQVWNDRVGKIIRESSDVWDHTTEGWIDFNKLHFTITTTQTPVESEVITSGLNVPGCSITPEQSPSSQSVGPPQDGGSLVNGVKLKKSNHLSTFRTLRSYGTQELVNFLEVVSCVMNQKIGSVYGTFPKLRVHDLSAENGGKIAPHASHQSGRDVDVGIYYFKNGKLANWLVEMCADANNDKLCDEGVVFDQFKHPQALQANWEFVKTMHDTYDISLIVLDQKLIDLIVAWAKENDPEGWSKYKNHKMISESHHHDHFHVRLKCPLGDDGCALAVQSGEQGKATRKITISSVTPINEPQTQTQVGEVSIINYVSSCKSNEMPQNRDVALILPKNAGSTPDVYFYFRGHSSQRTEETLQKYLNRVKIPGEVGNNVVVLIGQKEKYYATSSGGSTGEWMSEKDSTGEVIFSCYYNEAIGELKKLQKNPSSISLMGHSAGGKAVSNVIKSRPNVNFKSVVFFDACYASWCQDTISAAVQTPVFIYYNDKVCSGSDPNDEDCIAKSIQETSTVKKKSVTFGHTEMVTKCFLHHLNSNFESGACTSSTS